MAKKDPKPSFPRPIADAAAGDNDLRHAIRCFELLIADDSLVETIRRALLESACISTRRLFESGRSLDPDTSQLLRVRLEDIPEFPDSATPKNLRYLIEYANKVVAHRVEHHSRSGPPPLWDNDRTQAVLEAVYTLASMNRHPSAIL